MESTVRFLLFLRKLISFFRKRWDQSSRVLWYIFTFVRSHVLSKPPKKGDKIRRNIEYRPTKPPTTVICTSRLPPTLTPIAGGDAPIVSPTPISIRVRQPEVLNPEHTVYETHENNGDERLRVDDYFLEESRQISRSPDSPSQRDEPELTLGPYLEGYAPNPPENSSPSTSRPVSQSSCRPASQYSVYRPPSQYSHRPPSQYSCRSSPSPNDTEATVHEHSNGSRSPSRLSPPPSRPQSVVASVGSRVHHASGTTFQMRGASPTRDVPRCRTRSFPIASTHLSVYNTPLEFPPLSPSPTPYVASHERRAWGPTRPSTIVGSGSELPASPKGRLRPMIGIDRYEKHKAVAVEEVINPHVLPPVTTQFPR